MGLEILDCTLCGIAPVHMGGHHLVIFFPFFLDGSTIFCAGFVVQDFEVHFVAALFYLPAGVVVGGNTVEVVLGAEGIKYEDISVVVVI